MMRSSSAVPEPPRMQKPDGGWLVMRPEAELRAYARERFGWSDSEFDDFRGYGDLPYAEWAWTDWQLDTDEDAS